jgi:hypothetical protein
MKDTGPKYLVQLMLEYSEMRFLGELIDDGYRASTPGRTATATRERLWEEGFFKSVCVMSGKTESGVFSTVQVDLRLSLYEAVLVMGWAAEGLRSCLEGEPHPAVGGVGMDAAAAVACLARAIADQCLYRASGYSDGIVMRVKNRPVQRLNISAN